MLSTTNRLPLLVLPHRASGYERTNNVIVNRDYDLTDVFAAGAMVSSILDLAKWSSAIDGDHILTARTKDLMWTPATLRDGKKTNYGLGWGIASLSGHRNFGHSGSTSGFSASFQRFPDDSLSVIVLTNTGEEIATKLGNEVAEVYFKQIR